MRLPNAFALGGVGSGAIVLDGTLFRLLDEDELAGIVAHELAHLESGDGLVQTLAYSALRTTAGVILLFLAPILAIGTGLAVGVAWVAGNPAAWARNPIGRGRVLIERSVMLLFAAFTLVIFAYSRRREFAADDRAAEVTGDPLALARALRKIERASDPRWGLRSLLDVRGPEENSLQRLFSTHPATDERVERLVERADERRRAGTRISIE
jgi:heat shock protein HtpX